VFREAGGAAQVVEHLLSKHETGEIKRMLEIKKMLENEKYPSIYEYNMLCTVSC
jgi:hypothetical protein